MSKTKIINLYGGPGTGKSTAAAFVYHQLKCQHINAELVREYVKEWAWEKRPISMYDQIYFLGKQSRKESMLYGKVDWIVTDAPIMMILYYAQKYCSVSVSEGVRAAVLALYRQAAEDGHQHYHVLLNRTTPYQAEGRYQTEKEALEMDDEIYKMLSSLKIPVINSATGEENLAKLLVKLDLKQDTVCKIHNKTYIDSCRDCEVDDICNERF